MWFLQDGEVQRAIIMHADNWPIGISDWNYTEMFTLIVCVYEVKFTFSVFSDSEYDKLALVDRIFGSEWFLDCADNKDLILCSFDNFWLPDEVLLLKNIEIVIS